jgi:bifunctional non-homologous end joining protein LigD
VNRSRDSRAIIGPPTLVAWRSSMLGGYPLGPMLPVVRPMTLLSLPEAFNDPRFVWEIKHDGFRSLAYVTGGRCRLFSRAGSEFHRFDDLATSIARTFSKQTSVVLDGEIVVLGSDGRSLFRSLLARTGPTRFSAFDLLWLNGRDVRGLPLVERKARLFDLLPADHARLLYVDHVEGDGARFLQAVSAMDLEGVIGKYSTGIYQTDATSTSWVKVGNPKYSQMEGRADLFERSRQAPPVRSRVTRPQLILT